MTVTAIILLMIFIINSFLKIAPTEYKTPSAIYSTLTGLSVEIVKVRPKRIVPIYFV